MQNETKRETKKKKDGNKKENKCHLNFWGSFTPLRFDDICMHFESWYFFY